MRPGSEEEENEVDGKIGHQRALNAELESLAASLEQLRVLYEQHFMGILPIAPFKEHTQIKLTLRKLYKVPFRSSAARFKLRAIETRYSTYNTYWEKVNKQREEGTYFRDVFKAELREQQALEAERGKTVEGKASKQLVDLFNTYKQALEKETGKKHNINFDSFQKSLIDRAKDIKSNYGAKKVSFKVLIKEGKVTVQATAKKETD